MAPEVASRVASSSHPPRSGSPKLDKQKTHNIDTHMRKAFNRIGYAARTRKMHIALNDVSILYSGLRSLTNVPNVKHNIATNKPLKKYADIFVPCSSKGLELPVIILSICVMAPPPSYSPRLQHFTGKEEEGTSEHVRTNIDLGSSKIASHTGWSTAGGRERPGDPCAGDPQSILSADTHCHHSASGVDIAAPPIVPDIDDSNGTKSHDAHDNEFTFFTRLGWMCRDKALTYAYDTNSRIKFPSTNVHTIVSSSDAAGGWERLGGPCAGNPKPTTSADTHSSLHSPTNARTTVSSSSAGGGGERLGDPYAGDPKPVSSVDTHSFLYTSERIPGSTNVHTIASSSSAAGGGERLGDPGAGDPKPNTSADIHSHQRASEQNLSTSDSQNTTSLAGSTVDSKENNCRPQQGTKGARTAQASQFTRRENSAAYAEQTCGRPKY